MVMTQRVDKRKNMWKVAEILAKNPNKTQREIAKEAWIWNWTVARASKELEQTGAKDATIAYIVGSARDRIKRVSAIFDRYVDQVENKSTLDNKDISLAKDIVKDDMDRVMKLWWANTDEKWWEKSMLTDEEMIKIKQRLSQIE